MVISNLCNYSDVHIVGKGRLTVEGNALNNRANKKLNYTFIDNADDIDIVMPMYNLLEYKCNYSMTSGSLWNYYKDEVNDAANENNAANQSIDNNKTTASKSFEYITNIVGKIPAIASRLDTNVAFPLKYLRRFWRSLDLSLINCEIQLDYSWSNDCVIPAISRAEAVGEYNPVTAPETTKSTFRIVTLFINNNIQFLRRSEARI